MANTTTTSNVPPLPEYVLAPRPSLVTGVSDQVLVVILPVVVYWIVSGFFHVLDTYDLCSQYRLHTPAELLKRNHVSQFDVLKDVILQQIIQMAFSFMLSAFDPVETDGDESYRVAAWAQRIRLAQQYLPQALAVLGMNSIKLSSDLMSTHPTVAGLLRGGHYPDLTQMIMTPSDILTVPAFASWELLLAKSIYHFIIPAIQFIVAIVWLDTWQYFWHRWMHMNKFLYNTLHSRHHRLYVPYAFGALYNHPVEGFLLDTLGAGSAYLVTGMTVRQSMWFFTCSTIKTIDDHCGYAFPWDPLQHVTSNNAAYHDVHHQSWGIKTNFSQPFFTFWDRFFDTNWKGGDVSARYERSRIAAQRQVDADGNVIPVVSPDSEVDTDKAREQIADSQAQVCLDPDKVTGGTHILREEQIEEREAQKVSSMRSTRRKAGSIDPKGDSLRALQEKLAGSMYGRSTAIVHTD